MRLTDTDRLEAFSDGVMAVIITIMAFEIKAPSGPTFTALHHDLSSLLVYALSFAVVGTYWNNHHHLLRVTDRMDSAVMWANLHLLFWLSLLPIVTSWVGRFPDHALPAGAYGFLGLGTATAYQVLVRCIVRANGAESAVARGIGSDLKGTLSLALYASGTAVAALSPPVSYALYASVAVMWFIPDRRLALPGPAE